jgi:hypothetical protein
MKKLIVAFRNFANALKNSFISEKAKLDFYLKGICVRRHDTVLESRLLERIFGRERTKRWNLEHCITERSFSQNSVS